MPAFQKNLFSAEHAIASATANSITVYVYPTASSVFDTAGANRCNISCRLATDPPGYGVQTGVHNIGSYWYSYTFTGLSPGTSYLITVDVLYAAEYNGNYGYDTKIVTTSAPPVVRTVSFRHYKNGVYYNTTTTTVNNYTTITLSNYAQAISNYTYNKATTTGSQSGTQVTTATITANVTYYLWYNSSLASWGWTTAEINAFNGHGTFNTLTAARWNAFVDKINAVCAASGGSWLMTYSTVAGAKGSTGAALTANKFNSVNLNIDARVETNIPNVSTGGIVYGSYFITLQNKLNQWIASL